MSQYESREMQLVREKRELQARLDAAEAVAEAARRVRDETKFVRGEAQLNVELWAEVVDALMALDGPHSSRAENQAEAARDAAVEALPHPKETQMDRPTYCHVRKEDLHAGSARDVDPPFASFDVVFRRDFDAVVTERDAAVEALRPMVLGYLAGDRGPTLLEHMDGREWAALWELIAVLAEQEKQP